MLKLFYFDILKIIRAKRFSGNIISNIIFSALYLFLAAYLILVGFFIVDIMGNSDENFNPLHLANNLLIYYIFGDLLARFVFQKIRGTNIKPILLIPLKKKQVIKYLILRSFISLFNFTPLLLFIPLGLRVIYYDFGFMFFILWILFVTLLIINNNLINFYFFKKTENKVILSFVYISVLSIIQSIFLARQELTTHIGMIILKSLLEYQLPIFVVVFSIIILLNLSYLQLKKKSYYNLDESEKGNFVNEKISRFLNSKNKLFPLLVNLELKLLLRNKRTRTIFVNAPLMFLFGFFILGDIEKMNSAFYFTYFGALIVSIIPTSYIQFAFTWESIYYDGYLTKAFTISEYVKSKFTTYKILGLVNLIFCFPFLWFGYEVFIKFLVIWLFELYFVCPVNLLIATTNSKKFNLNEGIMSSQGRGIHQLFIVVLSVILPFIIFTIFAIFTEGYYGLLLFALIGLLVERIIFNNIKKKIIKKKYRLAETFRIS